MILDCEKGQVDESSDCLLIRIGKHRRPRVETGHDGQAALGSRDREGIQIAAIVIGAQDRLRDISGMESRALKVWSSSPCPAESCRATGSASGTAIALQVDEVAEARRNV